MLKGKVEIEKDALTETAKPAEPEKVDRNADDDLVNMMGGLGIEAKCSICFTVYLLPLIKLTKESNPVVNDAEIAIKISRFSKQRKSPSDEHRPRKFAGCLKFLKQTSMMNASKQLSSLNSHLC